MGAYNPYLPQTYPNYGNYYPQQPAQQQSGIIWIQGIQEAQMYPVAPNNAVALWEQSGKTVYLKQADATGKPSLRVFDLVERAQSAPGASSGQDIKPVDYVTKEELALLRKDVEEMIGNLKGDKK